MNSPDSGVFLNIFAGCSFVKLYCSEFRSATGSVVPDMLCELYLLQSSKAPSFLLDEDCVDDATTLADLRKLLPKAYAKLEFAIQPRRLKSDNPATPVSVHPVALEREASMHVLRCATLSSSPEGEFCFLYVQARAVSEDLTTAVALPPAQAVTTAPAPAAPSIHMIGVSVVVKSEFRC
jgi:hypothetical protein